jgi:hypothetical protein
LNVDSIADGCALLSLLIFCFRRSTLESRTEKITLRFYQIEFYNSENS